MLSFFQGQNNTFGGREYIAWKVVLGTPPVDPTDLIVMGEGGIQLLTAVASANSEKHIQPLLLILSEMVISDHV